MTCAACGAENPAEARFCLNCGEELERRCPSCGETVEPGARFCSSCGASLAAAEEPAAPSPAPQPPARRSPTEERKVITCLYADLVGSTAAAERLDPEDVRARLAPFHARLREELERFGGTVEKFIGDAVVALFGAPVTHEDDPERAVRAALAIHDAIEEMNERDPSLALEVRIGVATGEALVRLDADPSTGEGVASGDVMNTGARLQTAAPPRGILVGEQTYRATQHAIEYVEATPVHAKGKTEPLPAWRAIGPLLPASTGAERDSPLVGRREELELLVQTLDRVRRERTTQLVTIAGVPGIGKSRLVFELFDRASSDGDPLVRLKGRSLPYGDGISFNALSEMAKTHAGILESDGSQTAEEKLLATVQGLIDDPREAGWVAGHLRPLMGIAADVELHSDRRTEAFSAWRRYFEAIAERSGLALVFEDLHWADDGLLDFVDHLVEWSIEVPLLVVGTTRPELFERRPGWGGGKRNAVSISLSPLSEAEISSLFGAMLERAVLPAQVESALIDRSGGNPLYAGEYARMLANRGFLSGDGNGAGLDRTGELPMPESVQGIIAARLDALPADEKAVVQDAAVLGPSFWVGGLAAVGVRERAEVEDRLHALERKEFVRRERPRSLGEHQYAFRHTLVRDVAYGQLARARRAEKHRRAAEWIESLAADRVDDHAEMIAHHYLSALELARRTGSATDLLADRARRAAVDASARATSLNAHAAAVRFLRAALDLTPPEDEGRPDLLLRLGEERLYAEQQGADELEEARDAFLDRDDRERAAMAEVLLSTLRTNQGRREPASEHIQRAVALVEAGEPSRTKALVLSSCSRYLMRVGNAEASIRVGREALALAEQLGLDEIAAHTLDNIGAARLAKGDQGGLEDFERSLETTRRINSPESVRAYRFVASVLAIQGELSRAFELFAEGRRAAERFGNAFERRWLVAVLVLEHYLAGRWDEAVNGADAFVAESDGGRPHYMETACRRVRGLIRIARGDLAGAAADAERSLEVAREANDPWFVNQSLAFKARTLALSGARAEAGPVVDELLAIWTRPDGSPVPGFEAVDLAFALLELGRGDELRQVCARVEQPTRWLDAALALTSGEPARAAQIFAAVGSVPDKAYALLRAGDPDGVAEARAFFEQVDAAAYAAEADRLLAR
jgi:class 3 adenylate cyclase/tetratricopeptide (TPR) repeat protein